jgi:putative hydrolase of the HAD superfamily
MIDTILFDLGNTLVRYFESYEFPAILQKSLSAVSKSLLETAHPAEPADVIRQRAAAEDHEAADYRTRPLEGRLARIFSIEPADRALLETLARTFLTPIFELAAMYDDTPPLLKALRKRGLRLGIVSNTPWGSPASLWQEELQRLGLAKWIDAAVFCRDVEFRKPAPPIFRYALERLQTTARNALFIGDNPLWDVEGPRCIGMRSLLVDRTGRLKGIDTPRVRSLTEVPAFVESLAATARGA